jgi:RimK family alpha-L-glutamate ligase
LQKTIEVLGKKVIDSSKEYYYSEDKWLFYLECEKHKIPTPETVLFLEDFSEFKKLLKEFNHWPVILKRVEGTMGEYVEKAENFEEAEKIIKHFWEKGSQKMPVIAQRFIQSPSYRVTVIDKKIVQTALKTSNGWKATGVYAKRIKRFKVNNSLRQIVDKIVNVFDINICGIDFLKENGKWIALEINSGPAFDFFECERVNLIDKTLNFLRREALKNKTHL